jgi:hypothetical protein
MFAMILFDQELWGNFPTFYSKVRLSNNQIKALLQQYTQPFTATTIQIDEKEKIEINRSEAINMMMSHLKRNEIIETIHHLYLIDQRKSNPTGYLQTILTGII